MKVDESIVILDVLVKGVLQISGNDKENISLTMLR